VCSSDLQHQQTAYTKFPRGAGGLATTEALAGRVIALPMHPYLDTETQDRIIAAVASFHNAAAQACDAVASEPTTA